MYSGIINIFKERGYTSNDVVQIVKKVAKSKAGHTGTLDPQATGVLPICLGKATKIAEYITNGDKQYVAKVVLGTATDTQDAQGAVIATATRAVVMTDVLAALPQFIGDIVQIPPMYSAVKVGGKKLYEYARQGKEIERKQRHVNISNIEILQAALPNSFVIRVDCSKGTYIRTLCADIGAALGTCAHMGSLIRTSSGSFIAKNTISLEKLRQADLSKVVLPIESVLSHMPKIYISATGEKSLKNGNKVAIDFVENPDNLDHLQPNLLFDHSKELVGIHKIDEGVLRPLTMLL